MSRERAEKIFLKLNEDFRTAVLNPEQKDFNQFLLGIFSGLVVEIQDLKLEIELESPVCPPGPSVSVDELFPVTNPMQPLVVKDGVVRFKANKVVQYLLDKGGLTLNDLPYGQLSQDDFEQFAQLIGYSVSGFGDLSYVSEETYNKATELGNKLCPTS